MISLKERLKNKWGWGIFIAFLAGVFLGLFYMHIATTMALPSHKPVFASDLIVNKDTVIRKENIYLCNDVQTVSQEKAAGGLIGINYDDFKKMFNEKDGWQVQFLTSNEVVLARKVDTFCPKHQAYRHLGIYQGTLAIYQGPLGIDLQPLEVLKNKQLKNLDPVLQEKLEKARNFNQQSKEIQDKLVRALEFSNEEQLNAALENIDEM